MFSGRFNPQNASLAIRIFVPLLALGVMGVFLFQIGHNAKAEKVVATCCQSANAQPAAVTCHQPADAADTGDTIELSEAATEELTTMLDAYFVIGDDLASDSVENGNEKAHEMLDAFSALETETPAEFWESHKKHAKAVRDDGDTLAEMSDIKSARTAYGSLSEAVDKLTAAMGAPTSDEKPVYKYICGMASGVPHGGMWLQKDKPARNPYFGRSMLRCHREAIEVPAVVTETPSPDTPE